MKAKGLPGTFLGEVVTTAVFILNRSTTRNLDGKTPYEVWHGERPAVSFFRTFGCIAHVRNTKPHLKKLEDRSTPMIFIDYEAGSKAYRMFNPMDGRVHVTHDAVFDEGAQWDWGTGAGREDGGGAETFSVEFPVYTDPVVVEGEPVGGSLVAVNSPPVASTPSTVSAPMTPPAPAPVAAHPSLETIEFAMLPCNVHDALDANQDDDAPLRFRTLKDVLGPDTLPGLVSWELARIYNRSIVPSPSSRASLVGLQLLLKGAGAGGAIFFCSNFSI